MEISHTIYHSRNFYFRSGRKKIKDCLNLPEKSKLKLKNHLRDHPVATLHYCLSPFLQFQTKTHLDVEEILFSQMAWFSELDMVPSLLWKVSDTSDLVLMAFLGHIRHLNLPQKEIGIGWYLGFFTCHCLFSLISTSSHHLCSSCMDIFISASVFYLEWQHHLPREQGGSPTSDLNSFARF